jgi:hypothetical protein
MPDNFIKGKPHRPWSTLTGHYQGMQPVTVLYKPTEAWARWDDYLEMVRQRDAWAGTRKALEAAVARIADLEATIDQLRAAPLLTDELERKPPKRAGEKSENQSQVSGTHAAAEGASIARQTHAGDHSGQQPDHQTPVPPPPLATNEGGTPEREVAPAPLS